VASGQRPAYSAPPEPKDVVGPRRQIDEDPGLGARFDARSIPLLVVLRDGHEVDRITGALSRQALESRLAPILG
jgi:thioredoxin-like negative regulator of GroEL